MRINNTSNGNNLSRRWIRLLGRWWMGWRRRWLCHRCSNKLHLRSMGIYGWTAYTRRWLYLCGWLKNKFEIQNSFVSLFCPEAVRLVNERKKKHSSDTADKRVNFHSDRCGQCRLDSYSSKRLTKEWVHRFQRFLCHFLIDKILHYVKI